MNNLNNEQLAKISKWTRLEIFKFKTKSGYGHLASCLSCVDILVSILFDSNSIFDKDHDRIIFSKGHGSPAIYPLLVKLGFIDEVELENYCTFGGRLRLHADYSIPGCTFVGGSLGNGIGFAAGMAIARSHQKFFVILGDAELYEGSVWESMMFIKSKNLTNLITIIDRNKFGILGNTEEIIPLNPLKDKFEAFGFKVIEIDGHNFDQLRFSFKEKLNAPLVVIANTIKGKGVSYMEDKYEYHTIIPSDEQLIKKGIEDLA